MTPDQAHSQSPSLRIGAVYSPLMATDCAMAPNCPKRGIAVDAALTVCDYLNVTCTFAWATDPKDYGRYINGSWTGLTGDVVNGRFDASVPLFFPTAQRQEVVDFSSPYFYFDYVFVTRMPHVTAPPWTFGMLLAFDMKLWSCIIVSCFLISFFVTLLEKKPLPSHIWEATDAYRVVSTFLTAFQYLGGRDYSSRLHNRQRPALFALWGAVSIVLNVCYTGTMFSERLTRKNELPFFDFPTFVDCVESGKCQLIFTQWQDYLLDRLITSNDGESIRMRRLVKTNALIRVADTDEVLDNILTQSDKYLSTLELKYMVSTYTKYNQGCKYYLVDAPFRDIGTFAVQKGSPLTRHLNRASRIFRDNGMDIGLTQKYMWDKKDQCRNSKGYNTVIQVTIHALQGVFALCIGGVAATLAALAVENRIRLQNIVKDAIRIFQLLF